MGVPAVYIDPLRCFGCEDCEEVCPMDAITIDPRGVGGIVSIDCVGCMVCIQTCSVDAIKVYE